MVMRAADSLCVALLLAYLIWVPLPFGSNIDAAYVPLIVPPLILCAAAALLRLSAADALRLPRAYRIWSLAGVVLIVVALLQLIPLPPALAATLSPESHAIWSAADEVTAIGRGAAALPRAHPLSVNPLATWRELFRLIALFATFHAAALLISTNARRIAFASALAAAGMFEALYGIREAATQHYAIWGWVNRLIFNRVSGTFVNPNHFAHYAGVVLPFAIYLGVIAWRHAAPGQQLGFGRHLAALIERQLFLFSGSVAASLACIAAILLSQSRGALLSIVAGIAVVIAIVSAAGPQEGSRRRRARRAMRRMVFGIAVLTLVVANLVAFLGARRTISRFGEGQKEPSSLGGRRTGIQAAFRVWHAFPIFGSGAGTFADVVSIGQSEDVGKLYQHAHDDYAEVAATTGIFGAVVIAAFLTGLLLAFRQHLRVDPFTSQRGRAFAIAALTSLTIASVHALIDFNSFIPANAATIAAIAGAAVAPSLRARRSEAEAVALEPAA
jgi:O-antigen ligase